MNGVRVRVWATACALLAGACWPAPVCATVHELISNTEMTVNSRVIAIGIVTQENRPEGWTGTLRVESLLKQGEGVRPGDTVVFNIDSRAEAGTPPRTDRAIVWLVKGAEGWFAANWGNAIRPPDAETIATIRRDVAVLEDPVAHLAGLKLQAAPALNAWIRQRWFRTTSLPKPSDDVRRKAIAYLLYAGRKALGPDRANAIELLGLFGTPEAFPVFVEALKTTAPSECYIPAINGLEKLGDKRAVPALQAFVKQNPHDPDQALRVLRGLTDKSSVPWLIAQLKANPTMEAAEALSQLGDERALPALLDYVWQSDGSKGALVTNFRKPEILIEARKRLEDHPSAPEIVASYGDAADAPFMQHYILQGSVFGLAWAEKNGSKEALDTVAKAARTVPDYQFVTRALAMLRNVPGPHPGETQAALRLLRAYGYGYVGVAFIEARLGQSPTRPTQEQRIHAFQALRKDPGRFGLGPSDLAALTAWEVPQRKMSDGCPLPELRNWPHGQPEDVRAEFRKKYGDEIRRCIFDGSIDAHERQRLIIDLGDLAGLTQGQFRNLLAQPYDPVQFGALAYGLHHGIALSRDDVGGLRHSPSMRYYLGQVASGHVAADDELLAALVAEPWAQTLPELYEAIRQNWVVKTRPGLRALLTGNNSTVSLYAAMTLAYLGDSSGRAILEKKIAWTRAAGLERSQWAQEVHAALAALDGRR